MSSAFMLLVGILLALLIDTKTSPLHPHNSETGSSKVSVNINSSRALRERVRRKRFEYEDNYDWDADENTLNYETGEEDEEQTLFQKMARNWKTVAVRFIFLASFLIMLLFCCRCCCRLACPFMCDACCTNCEQIMEWVALYLKCGKDPAYKKFNKFAKAFGIEIDYATFQKIKKNYGFEGNLMDSSAQQKAAANY